MAGGELGRTTTDKTAAFSLTCIVSCLFILPVLRVCFRRTGTRSWFCSSGPGSARFKFNMRGARRSTPHARIRDYSIARNVQKSSARLVLEM